MSTTVEMVRFGRTLTDRPYGKQAMATILRDYSLPITLDFKGVISLGSSFADEIVAALGPRQDGRIHALNANGAVRACLETVEYDSNVAIDFPDG